MHSERHLCCVACGRSVSSQTGWFFSETTALCGICAIDFAAWYKNRMNRQNYSRGAGCFNEAVAKSVVCNDNEEKEK